MTVHLAHARTTSADPARGDVRRRRRRGAGQRPRRRGAPDRRLGRGRARGARTATSALHGLLQEDARSRQEFFALTGTGG